MKALTNKYLFMLLPMVVMSWGLSAQTNHTLSPGAEFSVSGTSSLHDWTMTSSEGKGEAVITAEAKALQSIEQLSVTMKAESLKSGKSGMDGNAYKALKTGKNPDIKFNLKNVKSIEKKGDYYQVMAEGTLTIAGESRTVDVVTKAYPNGNTIRFTGSKTFNMTDFKVDPPTALLGTIKTGDEITINFSLTFKSKQS
ncbi:hypothetical protein C900_01483 [Fulvivirga imtechensis AK7]|uniref:Lipid/polyisoprenoid-binding YceI-like domain-containing protein n=1 Tax=Fulvivirga imtechensis AK7 TaxID=1237149 RepID=L8JWA7_9BACT|nr:YceI family protein [Fulvivirga imtechensis]ELR72488.1 hypothetical protein C900_01483 [Fulvivirga imtechensis AK7]